MTKFARAIGPETETDGVLEALIAGGTPPGKERGTNADDKGTRMLVHPAWRSAVASPKPSLMAANAAH